MSIAALIILFGIIVYQGTVGYHNKRQLLEHIETMRVEFMQERQQLLDRIQAPTFAEYKTQEIRLEKVKIGAQEPPKLEQL